MVKPETYRAVVEQYNGLRSKYTILLEEHRALLKKKEKAKRPSTKYIDALFHFKEKRIKELSKLLKGKEQETLRLRKEFLAFVNVIGEGNWIPVLKFPFITQKDYETISKKSVVFVEDLTRHPLSIHNKRTCWFIYKKKPKNLHDKVVDANIVKYKDFGDVVLVDKKSLEKAKHNVLDMIVNEYKNGRKE